MDNYYAISCGGSRLQCHSGPHPAVRTFESMSKLLLNRLAATYSPSSRLPCSTVNWRSQTELKLEADLLGHLLTYGLATGTRSETPV